MPAPLDISRKTLAEVMSLRPALAAAEALEVVRSLAEQLARRANDSPAPTLNIERVLVDAGFRAELLEAGSAASGSPASDEVVADPVYELGSLLCLLATGEPLNQYERSPRVKGLLDPTLRPIVEGATAAEPHRKFGSLSQLLGALAALADGHLPQQASPPDETPGGQADGTLAQPAPALPFERLGDYAIRARLGKGGMGEVFLGYDEALDRQVAIKVLSEERAHLARRFRSEAMAVAKLSHPHVVQVFTTGEDRGRPYFVMQYVPGESLAQRLRRDKKLSVAEALAITRQCLHALTAAHQAGIVHRDVKPGNILLDARSGQALLVDFGLAKPLEGDWELTDPGVILGTLHYVAPEQLQSGRLDHRADLYSLGIVLFRMLSGRLPFHADSSVALLQQHLNQPAPRLAEADASPALAEFVARLLAKQPDDRFGSCHDALAALARCESDEQGAEPTQDHSRSDLGDRSHTPEKVIPAGARPEGVGPAASAAPLAHSRLSRWPWIAAGLGLAACAALWLAPLVTPTNPPASQSGVQPVDGSLAVAPPEPSKAPDSKTPDSKAPDSKTELPAKVEPAAKQPDEAPKGQAAPLAKPASELTVAILDFEAADPAMPDLGQQLSDALSAFLSGADGFRLVERATLARSLQEAELNLSGVVDAEQAVKVGKLVGARLVVTGRAFRLGKEQFITAKLVGTETSLVSSVLVSAAAPADLGTLVTQLAPKLSQNIRDAGPRLTAQPDVGQDPLPPLKARLAKLPLPRVAVVILEEHHASPQRAGRVVDPAVETEVKRLLAQCGFPLQDVPQNKLAEWARQAPKAGDRWPQDLDGVDIVIVGEAFSEFAARFGALISCSARAEINVIAKQDGRIVLADRTTTRAVDLSEQIAGKTALERAGHVLGLRVLQHFADALAPAGRRVVEAGDAPASQARADQPSPGTVKPAAPKDEWVIIERPAEPVGARPLVVACSNQGYWIGGRAGRVVVQWTAKDKVPAGVWVWDVLLGEVRLGGGRVALADGGATAQVEVTLPEVRTRTRIDLVHRLLEREGGQALAEGKESLQVFPPDLLDGLAARLADTRLAVWDGSGLAELLKKAGVSAEIVTAPSQLHLTQAKLLVVGPDRLDSDPFAHQVLLNLSRAGVSVLVFRQAKTETLCGLRLTSVRVPGALAWRLGHPLLQGFSSEDCRSWTIGAEVSVLEVSAHDALVRIPSDLTRPLALYGRIAGEQGGQLFACQLPIGSWRDDPRSQLLLRNGLEYFVEKK